MNNMFTFVDDQLAFLALGLRVGRVVHVVLRLTTGGGKQPALLKVAHLADKRPVEKVHEPREDGKHVLAAEAIIVKVGGVQHRIKLTVRIGVEGWVGKRVAPTRITQEVIIIIAAIAGATEIGIKVREIDERMMGLHWMPIGESMEREVRPLRGSAGNKKKS